MTQLNSHMFPEVYSWLGINLNNLGCVMLDVKIPDHMVLPITGEAGEVDYELYTSSNKERFWIAGNVLNTKPHITLLYGLLNKGPSIKSHIDKVLEGWSCEYVVVEDFGMFPSPYKDEDYLCIYAKIETTPRLLEGHRRLEFLPHVNTFAEYNPHLTVAYIKKSYIQANNFINWLKTNYCGQTLPVVGIDYGKA